MISVKNTLVSSQIQEICFCCAPELCKGACCVEGDAGAPLTEEEISLLEDNLELIRPFMSKEGIKVIDEHGVFEYDADGNFVTPLVNNRECAFVAYENDIANCAIENAFNAKQQPFRKPLSCHLYPIRITEYDDFDAVNYHEWHICKPALLNGEKMKLSLLEFAKDALIRKYGENWFSDILENLKP